jgi:predicted nucleic acid-binding protein
MGTASDSWLAPGCQRRELAGEINHSQKKVVKGWGMADSLILATARNTPAKVVTRDHHFEDLAETIMI